MRPKYGAGLRTNKVMLRRREGEACLARKHEGRADLDRVGPAHRTPAAVVVEPCRAGSGVSD